VTKYCIQGTNFYALPNPSDNTSVKVDAICKVVLTASDINVIKVDGVKSAEITLSSTDINEDDTYKKLAILIVMLNHVFVRLVMLKVQLKIIMQFMMVLKKIYQSHLLLLDAVMTI